MRSGWNAPSSGGTDARRRVYSLIAGRSRIDGSKRSFDFSPSMNMRDIWCGVMPLHSAAAMNPPALTPT